MFIISESERIKRLRETYLSLPIRVAKKQNWYYTHDRYITLGFLEGWINAGNEYTTALRRSRAERAELDAAKPVIYDDELILGHLYLPEYEGEELEKYNKLSEMFEMFQNSVKNEMSIARPDHIGLDYKTLLELGVEGLIEKIKDKKNSLKPEKDKLLEDSTLEKEEFYNCCLIELEGVIGLANRYAAYAAELAEKSDEPRKSELLEMAEIIRRVPAKPARTFREALQSMHFYTFNLFGLYPMGRPDRLLYKYYENDIKSGILTKELAQELIDNYCLLVSDYVFHRAASGFIVGGRLPSGQVVENDLTYMFLTALDHIRMPDPNGALAVCSDTSDEIIKYGAGIVAKGVTHPAFYNDDAITGSLIKNYGVKKEDAYDYIHTTCAEISLMGKTRAYTTCHVTILSDIVKEAVYEDTGRDFEAIKKRITEKIFEGVGKATRDYAMKILEASRNGLQPMRVSCLIDDCIERGRSVYGGGARYTFLQPILIGFANAVDSLVAIKKLVFEEKRLTLEEFAEAVKNDYKGAETLRSYIINKLPHYGNDNPETDEIAKWLADIITETFRNKDIYLYNYIMPGTFSYDMHAVCGAERDAGFDGRRAHTSYSDGCCPVQGRDINGPTAMIKSLTSWDQSEFLAGMVVNMKFGKSEFDDEKKNNLVNLVKTFMKRGGIETQINVVDKKTLLDAREHPENHEDLLVRIGGYSDYFVKQTPVMMQEIIDRTEH